MIVGPWQYRKFGPAASLITLAKKGGAILGGVWVTAKGTTPTIIAFDSSASVTAAIALPSYTPTAVGVADMLGGMAMGSGLTLRVASMTGAIMWMPSPNG